MQGLARIQRRAFADKAVATQVDWDAISNLVHSDEGKRELVSLRTTFLDIQTRLSGMSKDTATPNWAEWSKELDPKIVDGFKKAFESKFVSTRLQKLKFRFFLPEDIIIPLLLLPELLFTNSIKCSFYYHCSYEIAFV